MSEESKGALAPVAFDERVLTVAQAIDIDRAARERDAGLARLVQEQGAILASWNQAFFTVARAVGIGDADVGRVQLQRDDAGRPIALRLPIAPAPPPASAAAS